MTDHPPTPALTRRVRRVRRAQALVAVAVALLAVAVTFTLPAYVWAVDGLFLGVSLSTLLGSLDARAAARRDLELRRALLTGPWSGVIPGARQ